MKNRILFVLVNYNSYDKLHEFLESCSSAYTISDRNCELKIMISDNSTERQKIKTNINSSIPIEVFKNQNLGYLGGAFNILNQVVDLDSYRYVIIANVDLKLKQDFISKLLSKDYSTEIGWIAPMIFSVQENRDKNPKIVRRYSLNKIKFLRLLYTYPILHKLYTKTFYKRKKLRQIRSSMQIYAGHGSLMIFTGRALKKIKPLNYPVFLFGEECFFAEKLNQHQLKVIYDPDIQVLDMEHASTGNMKSKFYYKCNKEALSYIISEFYE